MNNVGFIDRILRALLGVALLEAGFFWLGGGAGIAAMAAGGVLVATSVIRFCPLYKLAGMNTCAVAAPSRAVSILAVLLVASLTIGGSVASHFFTRKLFLEDFNAMNNWYKQTLFLTGKNDRAVANADYDKLVPAYQAFAKKYSGYRPFALKGDAQLNGDLEAVAKMIAGVEPLVRSGDLHQAHLDLEKVRPVFQDMFKRNGFSMLAVALVDFHDAMELMLDAANAKNESRLVELYPQVSDKLKVVEAETNDAEIQAIRANLDGLLNLAKEARKDQLPQQGDVLKSSFVKVYLKRG